PRFGLTTESRVLQFAALGFDASISEIFTTLAAGGQLVLAPRAELRDPDRVSALLRARGVTAVTLPPAMLGSMADRDFPALATIVSAGDSCPAPLTRMYGENVRFLNAYGPTETTVCATMTGALDAGAQAPPIGRPLENLDVHILDRFLQPVPPG